MKQALEILVVFILSIILLISKGYSTIDNISSEKSSYNYYYHQHDPINYLTTSGIATVGLMFGGIAVLYSLPKSVSNWEKKGLSEDIKSIHDNWVSNVQEGPVWDKDSWFLNYVSHPYWGAVYYMQGRNAGLGYWGSFGVSFIASTIFWEYGLEAFAEVPSIQDIFVTPIIGSLMGEFFFISSQKIKQNQERLYDSKVLGYTILTLMDPGFLIIEKSFYISLLKK